MKTVAILFLLPVLQTECRRLKPTSESALHALNATNHAVSSEDFYAQDLIGNRSSEESICASLHPDGACKCIDKPGLAALTCTVPLMSFNPTVALEVDPCAKPATVKAVFRESILGIEKEIATDSENPVHAAIPGLTLPLYVANISVMMNVVLEEDADKLDLDINLNGCGEVMLVGKLCGNQIPGIASVLPHSLLKETIDTSHC